MHLHLMSPAFMGPIGMPELILILVLLAVPAAIVILIIVLIGRNKSAPPPPLPASRTVSAEERLAELEKLRAGNLITEAEYQEKRARIIDSL